jgi:D-3-phosphoglycerate dehydrogenase
MKTILIATEKPFARVAIDKIRTIFNQAGYEVRLLEKYTQVSDFLKVVEDADGLIIRSDNVSAEVLTAAKKLKIVVRAGAGYDNIDLPAATKKGVVAMNTPGQNSNAVAELVFGLMIYMARGRFGGGSGTELMDKTLGVHAFGFVGKRVAAIAKGFGMKVYAYDPFIDKKVMEAAGVSHVAEATDLYRNCQYVSLHIPANDQTRKSINADLLSLMPKGAVLINTARKEVIDEESLKKIFADRPDFFYLTDVEPDCHKELEEKYKARYFVTPKKMGAQTEEANINAGVAAAHQIVRFFEKGDRTYQVNK